MKKQVVIRGAGITGLSLGFYLKERFGDAIGLKILEKTDRCGGWIQTVREGPFLFEQGPCTLRAVGHLNPTLQLIEKVGLKEEVLFSRREASIRYLLKGGKLEKVPSSLREALSSPLLKGKKWDLLKGLMKPGKPKEDESVYSFAARRFSKEIAEEFFAPLALGIFGGDIAALSLKHCFPNIYQWDRRRIPFLFPMLSMEKGRLFTLKGGLATLPQRLAELLKPHITYGTTEEPQGYDYLFSTVPAIGKIPMQSIVIAHLGWHGLSLPYPGFGYLIPKQENPNLLGVVFDSEIFPEAAPTARLTVMMRKPDIEETLFHISKVLKIHTPPDYCRLSLAKDAIPQYPPLFDKILEQIYAETPQEVTFIGSSYTGVSINECIFAARKAAYTLSL